MKTTRTVMTAAAIAISGTVLAGCFGPTYGTGKTAGDQLFDDLGNSLSLGRKNAAPPIEYKPRPDIVKPADTSALPQPQEKVVDTSDAWPESPEQRRQRVLREIEEGNRPANFVTSRAEAESLGASEGPGRNARVGPRVYLTDPPAEYRTPAETAPYGDLGPTEAAKERARKRADPDNQKTGWRRLIPWL